MAAKTITIQPLDTEKPKKLTKIIKVSDGGFSVLVPYHNAQSGFITKFFVDYDRHEMVLHSQVEFTAEDRVKLSYHSDGFVQFSGLNPGKIISGRDAGTGIPKGVGIVTQPLSNPIRSGPSIAVGVWGMDDFKELEKENDDVIVFKSNEFYHRNCTPQSANAYILEVFVFSKLYWAGVRKRDGELYLSMALAGFEASHSVIDMRVFDIEAESYLLAGFVSRSQFKYSSLSGWYLSGPGELSLTSKRNVISAFYPRQGKMGQNAPSLDWSSPLDPGIIIN